MSQLALLGGKKSKSKPFPLWPQFDDTGGRGYRSQLHLRRYRECRSVRECTSGAG